MEDFWKGALWCLLIFVVLAGTQSFLWFEGFETYSVSLVIYWLMFAAFLFTLARAIFLLCKKQWRTASMGGCVTYVILSFVTSALGSYQ